MASIPILNASGSEVGTYEIDTTVLADRISKQLMHDVVVMYQANKRQGSHNTRTRAQVSGTNKKMYRQKGTGNARAGSKRTNIRRGGGVAVTVKPRDYSYRHPKKAVKLATRMAIRSRIDDNEVVLIDSFGIDSPKTSQMASVLRSLGLEGVTTLIATAEDDAAIYKSGRNIPGVSIEPVRQLNALSLLTPKKVLFTTAAMDKIKDGTFAGGSTADSKQQEAVA